MESYKALIGKKIQRRREEMGFTTQGAFATKLGTDQPQVSRWESGKHIPEGEMKRAIKELLDVDDSFFELIEITNQRDRMITQIVTALPSLNEEELRVLVSRIQTMPRKGGLQDV